MSNEICWWCGSKNTLERSLSDHETECKNCGFVESWHYGIIRFGKFKLLRPELLKEWNETYRCKCGCFDYEYVGITNECGNKILIQCNHCKRVKIVSQYDWKLIKYLIKHLNNKPK